MDTDGDFFSRARRTSTQTLGEKALVCRFSCPDAGTVPQGATRELEAARSSAAGVVTLPTSALGASASAATTATTAATLLRVAIEGVGGPLGALLERTLVGLDEVAGLVAECQGQALQAGKFDALSEDDGAVDLVERGCELFVRDHLADHRRHLPLRELEHLGQRRDRECVVEGRVSEEIGPEPFFLDLARQHLLDLGRLGHQLPHLDRVDELGGALPLSRR